MGVRKKILTSPQKGDTIKATETRQSREKGRKPMKQISINNGATYTTPADALKGIDIDTMAVYMDDDTREAVHAALAPCSDVEFLTRYLELAPDDLIIG